MLLRFLNGTEGFVPPEKDVLLQKIGIWRFDGLDRYALYFAMSRATWTPLAEAWDREWVIPLPSPMIYRPG